MIMRKAAAMLEGHDHITRLTRLYFAFVNGGSAVTLLSDDARTAGGAGMGGATGILAESLFSRVDTLTKLGRVLMDLKVRICPCPCPCLLDK